MDLRKKIYIIIMTTTKVRTLKNGTIKTYQYETNKEYNDKYYNENKTKILKKNICDVCGGSYHLFNKMRHYRTEKHLKVL
jgi:hypothetical protein